MDSVNAFVRDGNGWRQYAIMSLAEFERTMERATGRLIATDCRTGKVVAWTHAKDAPRGES